MFRTVTSPARILALRDRPCSIGHLIFSILPDPLRIRVICSDLTGAVEVRQHLDSLYTVRGTVILHRARPEGDLPTCEVIDGPCLPAVYPHTFTTIFAALLHDDDLDGLTTAMIRVHDRDIRTRSRPPRLCTAVHCCPPLFEMGTGRDGAAALCRPIRSGTDSTRQLPPCTNSSEIPQHSLTHIRG